MVSRANRQVQKQQLAQKKPHFGLRKLAVGGVASVLLGVSFYYGTGGVNATTALADSNSANENDSSAVTTNTAGNKLSGSTVTLSQPSDQASGSQSTERQAVADNKTQTATNKTQIRNRKLLLLIRMVLAPV